MYFDLRLLAEKTLLNEPTPPASSELGDIPKIARSTRVRLNEVLVKNERSSKRMRTRRRPEKELTAPALVTERVRRTGVATDRGLRSQP